MRGWQVLSLLSELQIRSVYQGRYKSFLGQHDYHLLIVLSYIEANPLRAGLVTQRRGTGDGRALESRHRARATG